MSHERCPRCGEVLLWVGGELACVRRHTPEKPATATPAASTETNEA